MGIFGLETIVNITWGTSILFMVFYFLPLILVFNYSHLSVTEWN